MKGLENLQRYVTAYAAINPSESADLQLITDYLKGNAMDAAIDRKNFNGHITTSAFIVNSGRTHLLLLHHKSLNRWLQPGGHAETTDESLLASALREASEETGIPTKHLTNLPLTSDPDLPFDIDSHHIPANDRKLEPGHYHHDLRYLFIYSGDGAHHFNTEESTGMQWVNLTDLYTDNTFASVSLKIANFLAK